MGKSEQYDLICVGGGAAGYFTAIRYSELCPEARILILEKSNKVLSKVRISGGGRCNVTHACFAPREMTPRYPRGQRELLGPFHQFLCGDMMAWLSDHGVETKIEEDGRVFPITDSSETIIDLFQDLCQQAGIQRRTSSAVTALHSSAGAWEISVGEETYHTARVMLATGSTPSVWKMMEKMGYEIVSPVPSLFTFNSTHPILTDLQGLSMPAATVRLTGLTAGKSTMVESGPLLITHWGMSGPAILKLSARGAREMAGVNYRFEISVSWIAENPEEVRALLSTKREMEGRKTVSSSPLFGVPKRLWARCCELADIRLHTYGELTKAQRESLVELLCECRIGVEGKSTYKDEFVTCGGVERKQINFKTMESRLHPGLFMAGEVLDIDAVTGGFNFQAAWTEGWIAAGTMATLSTMD